MPEQPTFDALYRAHYRRVFGLCRQLLGNAGQAEDVTQEAFMRAYRAFDRFDRTQPFDGWILKIARHRCIDALRRRSKEARLFDDEDVERHETESEELSAIEQMLASERAAELSAAVARLPERHRIPLVLAYYEEASYGEIAATLGITRNHLGVLILRAKRALRRQLGREAIGEAV